MSKPIALDGEFETPASMIDAIVVYRKQQAEAEEEEERVAEEAAKYDPNIQAWIALANQQAYVALISPKTQTTAA